MLLGLSAVLVYGRLERLSFRKSGQGRPFRTERRRKGEASPVEESLGEGAAGRRTCL